MAYRIQRCESLTQAVSRIATEQLQKAIQEIDDTELSLPKRVHQVRKRCKKIRGLLRLGRPASEKIYQQENAAARDAARTLAKLRDAKVMQDTYDGLMEHYQSQIERQTFAPIRGELTSQRRDLVENHLDASQVMEETREYLQGMKARSQQWCFKGCEVEIVGKGMIQTYQRARAATKSLDVNSTAMEYHELRKRVKYHMYHCRLLRKMWPEAMKARQATASELGDLLGADHDLAVLHDVVSGRGDEFAKARTVDAFTGLIEKRRRSLEDQSVRLAKRLFVAEKPKRFQKRIERYWELWKA